MTVLEERRAYWRATIDKQTTSGMSIVDYCQGNHINRDLFYAWRRRFKEKQPGAGGFLELIPSKPDNVNTGIRIHIGAKFSIEVGRGFDPFTLRTVVEVLSDLPRCSA
jgi:hypothetical protein